MMPDYIILLLSKHKRELLRISALPDSSSASKWAILFFAIIYLLLPFKMLYCFRLWGRGFFCSLSSLSPFFRVSNLHNHCLLYLLVPLPPLYPPDVFLIAAFTTSFNKEVWLTEDVLIHSYEIGVLSHLVNFPIMISSFNLHESRLRFSKQNRK